MACHHVGGFVIVRLPGGEKLPLVLSDTAPAFSPDGATIAYGWNWRLHVMDLVTRQRRTSTDLVSPITGLCFGGDGALFTELADGSVVEWDAGAL